MSSFFGICTMYEYIGTSAKVYTLYYYCKADQQITGSMVSRWRDMFEFNFINK